MRETCISLSSTHKHRVTLNRVFQCCELKRETDRRLCCVLNEDYLVIFIDNELENMCGMKYFLCLRSVKRRRFQIRE
jgi:hypothetical protein